jgi:hypothetical protein
METHVTLICRACKTPNSKESKDFLKFYKKQVKVPCDHCNADITVLVDDTFLKNTSTDTEEHTQIFIQSKDIWTSSKPATIYIKNTANFRVMKVILQEGVNIFGRAPKQGNGMNCIAVEGADRSISRSHLTITAEKRHSGFAYLLKDNNSSNGTCLNEEKLTKYDEVYLENQDVITIGTVEITMSKPL